VGDYGREAPSERTLTKDTDQNRFAIVGVEAPARQGVRSTHIGHMHATNNAARRDASAFKMVELFWSVS